MQYVKHRHTKEPILLPGLKLIGGKNRVRDLLYEHFPKNYDRYIEPFMGTGGVVIGKDSSNIEVVGDLNEYAIGYYKLLQKDPEAFWTEMNTTLADLQYLGKPYYKLLVKEVTLTKDPVLKSVYFYLITKHCMNGIWRLNKSGQCNSSYCGTVKGRGIFTRPHFDAVVDRVKNIDFRLSDYKDLLDLANKVQIDLTCQTYPNSLQYTTSKETFVFLDPPYLLKSKEVPDGCVTTYNGCKFLLEDHHELHDKLVKADYKWALTINDCLYVRELYKNFNRLSFSVFYSSSQTKAGRGHKPELLIMNYDPSPTTFKLPIV